MREGLYFFYNFELETSMNDVKDLVNLTNIYLENKNNEIMGFSGEGETIIVIDNTFDTNHTFIKDNIVKSVCFSVELMMDMGRTNSLCNNPEPFNDETYSQNFHMV